ncbi:MULTISPECIES: competence protein CoiA family protein [unclassified Methylobacterium]|uniref:competence protein CoiA family protein n=1 Tax=unclassified Methylobacterium TaxID=2615210 RepID=UPI0036F4CEC7
MIIEALVQDGDQWIAVSPVEARAMLGKPMRCPSCSGPVHLYTGVGTKPHFGHNAAHTGCKLSHNFSGTASLHPDAIA